MAKQDFCKRCPVGGTFNEDDQTCSMSDPADGLPVSCVGQWAEDKHARVRKYVDISHATRRQYIEGPGGATYIDLFCGPGRARIRQTTRIIDGSTLVAVREAMANKAAFTEVHIADANEAFVSAAKLRLQSIGVATKSYIGTAEKTVNQIAANLGPYGLHFAFLDPYDLKGLAFTVIARLAVLKRMDMLIHVSIQDLQRNLRRYIESTQSPLDSFAPDWRHAVDPMNPDGKVRTEILAYWLGLIRSENMQPSQGVELVTGPKNQHLYWLIFVARHKLALRFWEEIRNVGNQTLLGF